MRIDWRGTIRKLAGPRIVNRGLAARPPSTWGCAGFCRLGVQRPGVPHLHRPVRAGGGEPLAVGAERHARRHASVCPLRVRVSWPVAASHTFTVLSTTGGGEALAVGAERHARDTGRCAP